MAEFPLTQLPEHLVVEVLSKLFAQNANYLAFPYGKRQLFHPIASSCRRLRELFFSEKVWRRVLIDQLEFPDAPTFHLNSAFFAILSRMANAIHKLHVRGNSPLILRLFPRLPHFANLRQLGLEVDNFTPVEMDLSIQRCPSLTSLNLSHRIYMNDRLLMQIASGWPNLVEINIDRWGYVTPDGIVHFVTVVNNLRSIDIGNMYGLTDSHIDQITRLLSGSLRSISFGYRELSRSAMRSICHNCPFIDDIWIRNATDIGDLKFLSNLKRLRIDLGKDFPSASVSECFSRTFPHLRHLFVGLTNITDSQLDEIASSCPSLESLTFHYEPHLHVTDAGVIRLVNKCPNLRGLCLEGFPLVTERSFIGAAQKLPNFRYLHLAGAQNLDENVLRDEFANTEGVQIRVNYSDILRT